MSIINSKWKELESLCQLKGVNSESKLNDALNQVMQEYQLQSQEKAKGLILCHLLSNDSQTMSMFEASFLKKGILNCHLIAARVGYNDANDSNAKETLEQIQNTRLMLVDATSDETKR